ncbi:MAG: hypothetical protein WA843_00145, partial [Candidatus Saccharimonadales bacterium]
VKVKHRSRKHGSSKYGLSRFAHGAFDFVTVLFVTRFRHRPLHFFGYIGSASFMAGFMIGIYLTVYKLTTHTSIGERPLLLLAMLLIIVGVQIATVGIIGEQFVEASDKRLVTTGIKSILTSEDQA